MPYTTDQALAIDAVFRARLTMAMTKAATQIATEARTIRNEVDDKRNALAVQVLNSPPAFIDRFSYASIVAGALVTASTDANIDAAVSAVWNGIAGVTTENLA